MDQTDRSRSSALLGDQSFACTHLEKGTWIAEECSSDNRLAGLFKALSFQLSLVVLFFSVVILSGYSLGVDYLYRPVMGGPATHPFTAILCFFLAMAVICPSDKKTFILVRKAIIYIVFSIVSFSLVDYIFGSNVFPGTFFFGETVSSDHGAGLSNYLSINTDVMLFLIGCSLLAESFRRYLLSQLFAYFSIAIPCLSFIGYIYGIHSFYSHMSIYTALLGFMLGWAVLASTSKEAGVKAVLSQHMGGKITRIQVVTGMFLPFLLGLFLIPYTDQLNLALISIFVILLTWVLVLMSCISAVVQEKIESARQKTTAQLVKAASTDPLTGLLNRRQFVALTETEYRKAIRRGRSLALLMIDVDNFKSINDAAGHSVGDRVLVQIAEAISSCVRDTDLVCRFGGEEFTVLLLDSSHQGVERVCDKILQAVAEVDVGKWAQTHGPVTVSIGTSLLSEDVDFEYSLKIADSAMYQSKQMGKNQAVYLH